MKNFFQFLSEAQSQASMQAKKLNLKSDGSWWMVGHSWEVCGEN